MAKTTKSVTFKNAVISVTDRTITEYTKDDSKTYNLDKVITDWNGITGISFTIKMDDELEPDEDKADTTSFTDEDEETY